MWAPERQCAWTTTERRFISIRIGSVSYLITYNNKWQGPALGARSGGSKNVTYRQQTT